MLITERYPSPVQEHQTCLRAHLLHTGIAYQTDASVGASHIKAPHVSGDLSIEQPCIATLWGYCDHRQ